MRPDVGPCALLLQAILNVLLNCPGFQLGTELSSFREFVSGFPSDMKGANATAAGYAGMPRMHRDVLHASVTWRVASVTPRRSPPLCLLSPAMHSLQPSSMRRVSPRHAVQARPSGIRRASGPRTTASLSPILLCQTSAGPRRTMTSTISCASAFPQCPPECVMKHEQQGYRLVVLNRVVSCADLLCADQRGCVRARRLEHWPGLAWRGHRGMHQLMTFTCAHQDGVTAMLRVQACAGNALLRGTPCCSILFRCIHAMACSRSLPWRPTQRRRI